MSILNRQSLLFFFFLWNLSFSFAQYKVGSVIDEHTGEPLAFVTIIFDRQPTLGTMTDIDGVFRIPDSLGVQNLTVTYVGYEDLFVEIGHSLAVKLRPTSIQIKELVVRPAENPANRIIRKVIQNKRINNPKFISSFQYKSYNKVKYHILFADSTKKEAKSINQVFKGGPLMLMESVTERKYIYPEISEETVLASKVSGFKHPSFAALATDIQPFGFYQDLIVVYDVNYLNPISKGSLKRYQFKIEDTLFQKKDTTYILSFAPRNGKNFDALTGLLYISTNQYAIQNVIAKPFKKGLVEIKIQQQYEWVNSKHWFPKKLNFKLKINPTSKIGGAIYVIGKSYFSDIDLNPSLRKKDVSVASFIMMDEASNRSSEYWNQYRAEPLKPKEIQTYHIMDSIGALLKFDALSQMAEKLAVNKLGIGIFDLDISDCLVYNQYENTRLGIGLHTNEKLSKKISVGSFVGYGWKDKKWKYGGDIIWTVIPKDELTIQAKYQDNLRETGRSKLNGFDRNQYDFRSLLAFRMDRIKQSRLAIGFRAFRFAKFHLILNRTEVSPRYNYSYISDNQLDTINYTNSEISFGVRYAFAEKFYKTKTDLISQGTKYPVLTFFYSRGLKDILNGELTYNKYEAAIEESIFIRNFGRLNVRIEGGYMDSSLPYGLLFSGDGSKSGLVSIMVPNYFQTASTQEFLADQYINVFFSHNFGSLFTIKKFSPHFIIQHNMGWGRLSNASDHHNIYFSERNKGLYEVGLRLDNLLKLNVLNVAYLGIGAGTFYRYGAYSKEKVLDNFAFKFSVTYTTK